MDDSITRAFPRSITSAPSSRRRVTTTSFISIHAFAWIKPDVIHTRAMMFASSSTARLAPPPPPTTKSARRVRARGAVVVRAGRFETERTYIMIKCVDDAGRMIRFDDGARTRDDVDDSSSEASSANASLTSGWG